MCRTVVPKEMQQGVGGTIMSSTRRVAGEDILPSPRLRSKKQFRQEKVNVRPRFVRSFETSSLSCHEIQSDYGTSAPKDLMAFLTSSLRRGTERERAGTRRHTFRDKVSFVNGFAIPVLTNSSETLGFTPLSRRIESVLVSDERRQSSRTNVRRIMRVSSSIRSGDRPR